MNAQQHVLAAPSPPFTNTQSDCMILCLQASHAGAPAPRQHNWRAPRHSWRCEHTFEQSLPLKLHPASGARLHVLLMLTLAAS